MLSFTLNNKIVLTFFRKKITEAKKDYMITYKPVG